ncbi:MAG: alpha/beta fold hydrolase, partial [Syntrophaceae bacterium]
MMQGIHPDPFEIISTFSQVHNYWMVKERDLFNEKLNSLIGELEEIEKDRIAQTAAPAPSLPVSDKPAPVPGEKEALLKQVKIASQSAKKRYSSVSRWLRCLIEEMPPSPELARSRAVFWMDQFIHALAPANFFWTNPRAVQLFIESGGESLQKGALNALADYRDGELLPRIADINAFRPGENIATTAGSVVFRNELIELLQYDPAGKTVLSTPVLLIPPWINKYSILDLNEQASLVRHLVESGFNVFMISWRNPGADMRQTSVEDYLFRVIDKAVRAAKEISRARQVHAAGYCIGGTALACYLGCAGGPGNAEKESPPVADWTLFSSLADFSDPGEIGVFISERSFRFLEFMTERDGYLDSKFINSAFRLLRPQSLLWPSFIQNYLYGGSPPKSDVFFWNSDGTRLPQAMASFYLREFYLGNSLAGGSLLVGGRRVGLSSINKPLYVVAPEQDHISPWKSVYKTSSLVNCPVRVAVPNEGHITGIVNPPSGYSKKMCRISDTVPGLPPDEWLEKSDEVPGSWWPDWVRWLSERSGPRKKARGPGSKKYPPL